MLSLLMRLYKFTSYDNIHVFIYIDKQYVVDSTLLDTIISINKCYKSLKICTRTRFFLNNKRNKFSRNVENVKIVN